MPVTVADYECLRKAQELVDNWNGDVNKLLDTLRTAEAVVRSHNVFLCYEAMCCSPDAGGGEVIEAIFGVLHSTGILGNLPDDGAQRQQQLTALSGNLDKLLSAKNILRRMLTYAIAYAKTC